MKKILIVIGAHILSAWSYQRGYADALSDHGLPPKWYTDEFADKGPPPPRPRPDTVA